MGAVRHVSDIKADDATQEGQGIINLQLGTNQFASQKGMSMGSVRHVSDIKSDNCSVESHGILNLQSGKPLLYKRVKCLYCLANVYL